MENEQLPTGLNLENIIQAMENKKLPAGIKLKNMQAGVKQWSQFVAWSWTDYLAFGDDEQKKLQEKKLKKFFIKILQDQARYRYAVSSYGDEDQKQAAYEASLKIKKLLMGQNSKIDDIKDDLTLTLKDVYQKLTNQEPESLCYEPFMKQFHVEIVTNSFSGYVREASDNEKKEIKYYNQDKNVQYVIYLAYPPCPAFGEATVTKDQLENWMRGKTESGGEDKNYLPPSAYIPVSLT